jgi:hypothetical protein
MRFSQRAWPRTAAAGMAIRGTIFVIARYKPCRARVAKTSRGTIAALSNPSMMPGHPTEMRSDDGGQHFHVMYF